MKDDNEIPKSTRALVWISFGVLGCLLVLYAQFGCAASARSFEHSEDAALYAACLNRCLDNSKNMSEYHQCAERCDKASDLSDAGGAPQ